MASANNTQKNEGFFERNIRGAKGALKKAFMPVVLGAMTFLPSNDATSQVVQDVVGSGTWDCSNTSGVPVLQTPLDIYGSLDVGLGMDGSGNLIITDCNMKKAINGMTQIIKNGSDWGDFVVVPNGDIYAFNMTQGTIDKFTLINQNNYVQSVFETGLTVTNSPYSNNIDSDGNYIFFTNNGKVWRKLNAGGPTEGLPSGPGGAVGFSYVEGADKGVFTTPTSSQIYEMDNPGGPISQITTQLLMTRAGAKDFIVIDNPDNPSTFYSVVIYNGGYTSIEEIDVNTGQSTVVLPTSFGASIVTDIFKQPGGNLYFVNGSESKVQKVVLVPLPVELLGFDVRKDGEGALVTWSTATEQDNDYFVVQRSADGKVWEDLGQVDGQGNSTTQKNYSFVDENPLGGDSYYRLKQVDVDGTFSLSPVKAVSFDGQDFTCKDIYPNPVADDAIFIRAGKLEDVRSAIATTVLGQKFEIAVQDGKLDVSNLPEGMNFVRFSRYGVGAVEVSEDTVCPVLVRH